MLAFNFELPNTTPLQAVFFLLPPAGIRGPHQKYLLFRQQQQLVQLLPTL
jgi:hypothetical protein